MTDNSQVDFIVRRFQEIQKQNNVILEEIKSANASFIDSKEFKTLIVKLLSDHVEEYNKYKELNNGQKSVLDQINVNQDHRISQINDSCRFLNDKNDNLEKSIRSLAESQNILEKKMQNLCSTEYCEDLSRNINLLETTINQLALSFESNTNALVQNLNILKDRSHAQENRINALEQSLKGIEKNKEAIEWLSDHRKVDLENIEKMRIEITSFIDGKINEQIAAIPKPFIPSLDDAKAAMTQKLEPVFLDSKNANIRSANNESKIHVMEKKIEQLNLLMTKLQLES